MTTQCPTIEEQIQHWIPITRFCWKAPIGGYFLGPHGAWLAMQRRRLTP